LESIQTSLKKGKKTKEKKSIHKDDIERSVFQIIKYTHQAVQQQYNTLHDLEGDLRQAYSAIFA
jgi:hypothetical protein